ncbi:hypothetical protein AGMMS49587_09240 [Spirochaetia bacterium]|nr:hypothetical protein AGMMS49587_09240 [Spirochaetia bacterium]
MKVGFFIKILFSVVVIAVQIILIFIFFKESEIAKNIITLSGSVVLTLVLTLISEKEPKYYTIMAQKISDEIKGVFDLGYFNAISPTRGKMHFKMGVDSFIRINCKRITIIGETGDTLFAQNQNLEEELEKKDFEIFLINPHSALAEDKNKAFKNQSGENDFITRVNDMAHNFNSFVDRKNVKKIKNHYLKVYTYTIDPGFSAVIIEHGDNKPKEYIISPHIYSKEPKNSPCFHIVKGNKLYSIYHESIEEFLKMFKNDDNLYIANRPFKQASIKKEE